MLIVRLSGDHISVWEIADHLAVAGDVFDGIFFCPVLFPTRCLG